MLSWQAKVHAGHLNDNELGKCPWLKHEGKGPGKVLRVRVRVRARVRVRWGPGCLNREHSQIGHFTPGPQFNVLALTKCSYHKLVNDSVQG